MKSIVRKPKSEKAKTKDFYQTNPLMVKVLVDYMKKHFDPGLKILDPCCGKGVIVNEIIKTFPLTFAFDKYSGHVRGDFLEHDVNYDIIIMNPPYSAKYNFINHARELSRFVFCLLPLNISNYNMFHRDYENIPEFVGKIQMVPKMFLDETTNFNPGGNSQYCWYIWDRENKTDYSKIWYYDLREYLC